MAADLAEKEWQKTLVAAAEIFGYVVEHTYPLRTQHGWRTGSTLVGKPDLVMLRPPRLVVIECKANKGRLDPAQRAVLSLYAEIPNTRAWVLRPRDPWPDIQAWLRRPGRAPLTYGFDPMPLAEARRLVARGTGSR